MSSCQFGKVTANEIHLIQYPQGRLLPSCFKAVTRELPELQPGEVLVRNHFLSVDPYMRIRMQPTAGYMPAFQLNTVLDGHAIGEVVASRDTALPVGTTVAHFQGWRDYCIGSSATFRAFVPQSSLSHYLGVLGMPGMTAYIGLFHFGRPKAGEVIFVSAASGAVGANVCQLAKLHGCQVIASAGRDDKIQWLRDVGVDRVLNYKQQPVQQALKELAKHGLDIYFDNVGGDHLVTALSCMKEFGRIVMCGMISQYQQADPALSLDLFPVVSKRLTLSGFLLKDHMAQRSEFESYMLDKIQHKALRIEESVISGLSRMPQALIDLLEGRYLGKVVVAV